MTLRGAVLRVDGIKEKCLAAHRAGLKHLLFPARNEPDLDEVPAQIKKDLMIHLVSRVDEVLPLVLELPPAPNETHEQPIAEG
jgi:ATP-dependent Lon protease